MGKIKAQKLKKIQNLEFKLTPFIFLMNKLIALKKDRKLVNMSCLTDKFYAPSQKTKDKYLKFQETWLAINFKNRPL
jgi:hypothetical protein